MLEIWDVLDKDRNPTGKTVVRGNRLGPGEYHLVVHIWVVDDNGRLLIQKRADHLELFPGVWATTGGSAVSGENSLAAALRELREELGLKMPGELFQLIARLQRKDNFTDVWAVKAKIDSDDVIVCKQEVSEARFVSKAELVGMLRNGEFFDYGQEYFAEVFRFLDGLIKSKEKEGF